MNAATESDNLQTALGKLKEGLRLLIKTANAELYSELTECHNFVDLVISWCGKMPAQRIRETTLSLIRQINTIIIKGNLPPSPLLIQTLIELGPNLSISNDQMAIFFIIPNDMAHLWNTETLKKSLQRNRITQNIDEQAIHTCFAKKQFDQMVCAAKGKYPVPGENAFLDWKIKLIDNLNSDDVFNLLKNPNKIYYIEPVKDNQLVAVKKPLTDGIPGMDIYGNEVPTIAGVDIDIPPMPNCRISKDGLEIRSAIDGFAYVNQNKVCIVPTSIVEGNADYQSGNIQSAEGITVLGDILNEVRITTDGDIATAGYIGACTLQSGGSIFL